MTAPAVATDRACHYCGATSDLIQPFAYGTPVSRVICRKGGECVARMDAGTVPERPVIETEPHPEPLRSIPLRPEALSGRMEPREQANGPHRLQFLGLVATYDPQQGVTFGPFRVVCEDEPQVSVWARSFDAGHTTLDIERLVRQHNGIEDAS